MKKYFCYFSRVLCFCLFLVASLGGLFCFVSCQSAVQMQMPDVLPLALLSEDSSVYVAVPVQQKKDLSIKLMTTLIPSLSEDVAQQLATKCDMIYAGLATVQNPKRLEVVITGDFPRLAQNMAFSKKNGWQKQPRTYNSALLPFLATVYTTQALSGLELCFPCDKMLLVGTAVQSTQSSQTSQSSVDDMLNKFCAFPQSTPDTKSFSWLEQAENKDVRFYVTKPGQYLRSLIGSPVEIGVEAIYGSIYNRQTTKDTQETKVDFGVDFNVELKKLQIPERMSATMKAMISLLRLSLGMMGVNVQQIDDFNIKVQGLKVQENQLQNLLILKQ